MSSYVLDTSVAIAWYLPEPVSAVARVWQSRMWERLDRFFVPSFHFLEFANVLRTQVKRAELGAGAAQDIYAMHLRAPLTSTDPPVDRVLATALELGATAYDAAFVELASSLDLPFLTAEKATRPWVKALGDRVVALAPQPS